jgi:hypothetical protein
MPNAAPAARRPPSWSPTTGCASASRTNSPESFAVRPMVSPAEITAGWPAAGAPPAPPADEAPHPAPDDDAKRSSCKFPNLMSLSHFRCHLVVRLARRVRHKLAEQQRRYSASERRTTPRRRAARASCTSSDDPANDTPRDKRVKTGRATRQFRIPRLRKLRLGPAAALAAPRFVVLQRCPRYFAEAPRQRVPRRQGSQGRRHFSFGYAGSWPSSVARR